MYNNFSSLLTSTYNAYNVQRTESYFDSAALRQIAHDVHKICNSLKFPVAHKQVDALVEYIYCRFQEYLEINSQYAKNLIKSHIVRLLYDFYVTQYKKGKHDSKNNEQKDQKKNKKNEINENYVLDALDKLVKNMFKYNYISRRIYCLVENKNGRYEEQCQSWLEIETDFEKEEKGERKYIMKKKSVLNKLFIITHGLKPLGNAKDDGQGSLFHIH